MIWSAASDRRFLRLIIANHILNPSLPVIPTLGGIHRTSTHAILRVADGATLASPTPGGSLLTFPWQIVSRAPASLSWKGTKHLPDIGATVLVSGQGTFIRRSDVREMLRSSA
jgi:hypothetical protein